MLKNTAVNTSKIYTVVPPNISVKAIEYDSQIILPNKKIELPYFLFQLKLERSEKAKNK